MALTIYANEYQGMAEVRDAQEAGRLVIFSLEYVLARP